MKGKTIFSACIGAFLCSIPFTSIAQTTTNKELGAPINVKNEDKIPVDPNVKVGKLDNGLTYYIRNNGKPEDKVELRLVVNAGSILENENQLGLAHFMEHMNFNGTKNFKKNDLIDYLQTIGVKFGADLNAYTSFDQTVYILPIPSDDPEKLEKGFQIIEDWAHNAELTEEAIDGERGVVLEEYRLGKGANERMLQKYLPIIAYNSKYSERLPIGTKEVLENFKYEDVRSYYKDWYRPDLMSVVAVGDLDVATLEQKIKDHFSGIKMPKNPKKRETYDTPNHEETLIAVVSDKEASNSIVRLIYKDREVTEPMSTVGDYRKDLVEGVFSQMMNNRLNELRNSPNPPFVFAGSSHSGTFARNREAYQSFALTSETGQLNALKTILQENKRVQKYGFKAGELERAKKDITARWDKQFKDKDKRESSRIIGEYINNYLQQEPIPGIEWEYKYTMSQLPTISLEEVNGLIKDFLHDDNRAVVMTGPEKEGLKQVTKEEILTLLKEVETSDIEDYKDEKVRENLIEKMPTAGKIVSSKNNEKLGFTVLELSNGAKITYKKTDFKNDEILFSAYSYGGSSLYTDEDYLQTAYGSGSVSQTGLGGLSLNDMDKVMSGKIVRLRPYIGGISEGFNGATTPKDLESLFQQVYLYFTDVNKDEEAFRSDLEKQKGFLANYLSNPQNYFREEFSKFQYGKSPRYTGFPTAEKLDGTNYELAYQKYKERFAGAGGFNFYFVGNIDEAKLKEYAEKYIASLPDTGKGETYKVSDFRPLSGAHEKTIYKGKDPKSAVNIIWRGETEYSKSEDLAMQALGEILTIKLIEKLREDEGGVYGVGARGGLNKLAYGNYSFSISFPCGPENVKKLTDAAIAEVKTVITQGPTDKDLAKIKGSRLLDYKEKSKQNRFWLSNLQSADYEQTPMESGESYTETINKLSKQDVQNVAKKYLDKGYILGVLMPEKE
ncbi:M16 family metallopeptidase [Aquimarina sp. 2201CG14-23]|uniref:M16 family metallopeptidase n=1 Tax=Aquimarina mycalae TaxID=3040073 RepID=UPI002477E819|nr:insulinase family protein [Aquimarina sp. 2201CG14-23]MDH7444244.1 insulinase family protein [Aquimarina sp. 2201CG14-23]